MNRDEWMAGTSEGFLGFRPGRQLFVVAIDSEGTQTERMLRGALWDYFGSLNGGLRRIEPRPGADELVGEYPKGRRTTTT